MAKKNKKGKGFFAEFKEFINRGNAFMLAVGVVIGGAFSAIVNAFVNMLMSVATWGVPGGLAGLVTVLPAATEGQKGIAGIGQTFAKADIVDATIKYAASQGITITKDSTDFVQWQGRLLGDYVQHGNTYVYKQSAIIDWGSLINAVIAFIIIAIVLFIIVKVVNSIQRKNAELKAKAQEEYYQKHPEERPVPPEPGKPAPTEVELLTEIRDALKQKKPAAK